MYRKDRKCCIDSIGIDNYDFDFKKELNVYRYLCGERMTTSEWDALEDIYKFSSYKQWKIHIWQKYKDYNIGKLKEFSRYLCHRERSIKPQNEYWIVVFPILFTIFIDKVYGEIVDQSIPNSIINGGYSIKTLYCVCIVIGFIGISLFLILIIKEFINKIWGNNLDSNFCCDYREIIDEIVKEKERETTFKTNH